MFDPNNLDRVVIVLYNYQQLNLKLQMNMIRGIGNNNEASAPSKRVSNVFDYDLTNKYSDMKFNPKLIGSMLSFDFTLIIETKKENKSSTTDFNSNKIYLKTLDIPVFLTQIQNVGKWFTDDMGVFKKDGTGKVVGVEKKFSLSSTLYNGTQILLSPTIIADYESDIRYEGVGISTHKMDFAELTPMEFLGFVYIFESVANNIVSSSLDLANFIMLNHMYSSLTEFMNGKR